MKITIEFDSNNPDEMDTVIAALSASPVGKAPAAVSEKAPDDGNSEADKKAAAAAKQRSCRQEEA